MSTILTTIRWLSIFTGALSLFYLGNAWFEFGLGEVFTRIYVWYAGVLHPVVGLLKPVALWLVGLLGWSLPMWWKDGVVLYLMIGGATSRGQSFEEMEAREDLEANPNAEWATTNFEEAQRWFLLFLPLRFVLWPAFWIIDFVRSPTLWRDKESRDYLVYRILSGHFGSSLIEFAKIIAGAAIFAALNAGLG